MEKKLMTTINSKSIKTMLTIALLCIANIAFSQNVDRTEKCLEIVRKQIIGWEWMYVERPKNYQTEYPTDIYFCKYDSHPMYRIIGTSIYDEQGKLTRISYLSPYTIYFKNAKYVANEIEKSYQLSSERYEKLICELADFIKNIHHKYIFFVGEPHIYNDMKNRLFNENGRVQHLGYLYERNQDIFKGLEHFGFVNDGTSASCNIGKANFEMFKSNKLSELISWATLFNIQSKSWQVELSLPTNNQGYGKAHFKLKSEEDRRSLNKTNPDEISFDELYRYTTVTSSETEIYKQIVDNVQKKLMIIDYKNNRYGIKNESARIRELVEFEFGLIKATPIKEQNDMYQVMKLMGIQYSPKMTKAQLRNALRKKYPLYNDAQIGFSMLTAFAQVDQLNKESKATKFIRQLKSDYYYTFNNIPKIERIDDLSFRITFDVTSRSKKAIVTISYYNEKPYECKQRISVSIQ